MRRMLAALVLVLVAAGLVAGSDPTCAAGIKSKDGKACCPKALCGSKCGGAGCDKYGKGGPGACCAGAVSKLPSCSKRSAPCSVDAGGSISAADPNCAKGTLNSSGTACCPKAACGNRCGGSGCDKYGKGGAGQCCTKAVLASKRSCKTHAAPCSLAAHAPPPAAAPASAPAAKAPSAPTAKAPTPSGGNLKACKVDTDCSPPATCTLDGTAPYKPDPAKSGAQVYNLKCQAPLACPGQFTCGGTFFDNPANPSSTDRQRSSDTFCCPGTASTVVCFATAGYNQPSTCVAEAVCPAGQEKCGFSLVNATGVEQGNTACCAPGLKCGCGPTTSPAGIACTCAAK